MTKDYEVPQTFKQWRQFGFYTINDCIKGTGLSSTANGLVTTIETEIESLKIGKAEIKHTEAHVLWV